MPIPPEPCELARPWDAPITLQREAPDEHLWLPSCRPKGRLADVLKWPYPPRHLKLGRPAGLPVAVTWKGRSLMALLRTLGEQRMPGRAAEQGQVPRGRKRPAKLTPLLVALLLTAALLGLSLAGGAVTGVHRRSQRVQLDSVRAQTNPTVTTTGPATTSSLTPLAAPAQIGPALLLAVPVGMRLQGAEHDTVHYGSADYDSGVGTLTAFSSPDAASAPAVTIRATTLPAADASAILASVSKFDSPESVTVRGAEALRFQVGSGWTSVMQYRKGVLLEVASSELSTATLMATVESTQ